MAFLPRRSAQSVRSRCGAITAKRFLATELATDLPELFKGQGTFLQRVGGISTRCVVFCSGSYYAAFKHLPRESAGPFYSHG